MTAEPILVVDDNPINLKLTRLLLASDGYTVMTAGDAEEALTLVEEARPRLIFMDVQLPGLDGLELTRMLKSDPTTRDILIVALTAYAMTGDEERARMAGCDEYVTKPIDTHALSELTARLLQRSAERAA